MFRKVKSAFTLVELLLVVIIMGVAYTMGTSMINLKKISQDAMLDFSTLHSYLLQYSFENNIVLKCPMEEECFIFIDNEFAKKIPNSFFKKSIEVYEYNTNLEVKRFQRVELENMQYHDIVFEYKIDKYGKSQDMIVEADEKVYIFNSFHNQITQLNYLSDLNDYFDEKKERIKDAF